MNVKLNAAKKATLENMMLPTLFILMWASGYRQGS